VIRRLRSSKLCKNSTYADACQRRLHRDATEDPHLYWCDVANPWLASLQLSENLLEHIVNLECGDLRPQETKVWLESMRLEIH